MFSKIYFDKEFDVKAVTERYKSQLSEKEILKTTAYAINQTIRMTQGKVSRLIRENYTVKPSALKSSSYISKFATGTKTGAYAELAFVRRPLSISDFKTKDLNKKKKDAQNGIQVEIRKGSVKFLRHAFMKTLRSGRIAVMGHGKYKDGKFETNQPGEELINEMKTASPFSMTLNKDVKRELTPYITTTLLGKIEVLLEKKVERLTKK